MTSHNDAAPAAGLRWLAESPRRVERSASVSLGTDVAAALARAQPGAPGDPADVEALVNWLAAHYPWRLERRGAEEGVELVRFVAPTDHVGRDTDRLVRQWRAAVAIEAGMARVGDGRRRRRRVSSP